MKQEEDASSELIMSRENDSCQNALGILARLIARRYLENKLTQKADEHNHKCAKSQLEESNSGR